ncbi:Mu transposase C-terminal domain-containing protein [Bacillus multifaciens]|uniref:Mu transposase C-terminal domain-containing protein n=1 Tax=Bacillus multifaciens TaxID=3068506 RepID=UPI00274119CE|nr:Mu transposase C-terminal domain-containing protein [Bacillus sp. WLY-B-L8]MDP7981247.1 Mu transposase C-terminal domain-containing protein [Bacillus sp. WLY-B-L8]
MKELFVNMVLKESEEGKDIQYFRVLWINNSYERLVWFNLVEEQSFPVFVEVKIVLEMLKSGQLIEVVEHPYVINILEHELDDISKKKREERWKMICDLVSMKNIPLVFDKKSRGKMINDLIEEGYIKTTIYRWLKRYWRYGQNKNALLDNYQMCGGRGKEKKLGHKKVGAPRKRKLQQGEGQNITEDMKKKIKLAYTKYYANDNNTLEQAYLLFLDDNYAITITVENEERRILRYNIPHVSFDQFKYWGEKLTNKLQVTKAKIGEKNYNLTQRYLGDNSNNHVFGPGSVFQIDSTPIDIYLVSTLNPNAIIRRATLYFVSDVFSRMVAGFHVDTRPASLEVAKLAFYSAACNKQVFCKSLGVDIGPNEWIAEHKPHAIVADRGELKSKGVEPLAEVLGLDTKNTPSYRADLKGIVERALGLVQQKAKPFLPGYIDKNFGTRGSKDVRLNAALTIDDFRKYIIEYIRMYNQSTLENYEMSAELIRDGISPTPNELWNWGMRNSSGLLSKIPLNELKYMCMTSIKGRVTKEGLKVKNLIYASEEEAIQQWFALARKKTWTIEIVYDARNMSYVYYRNLETRKFIVFEMDSRSTYYGKSLIEIEAIQEYEKYLKDKNYKEDLERELTFNNRVKNIVNDAKERQANAVESRPINKTQRLKNIHVNTLQESYNRLPQEGLYLDEVRDHKQIKTLLNTEEKKLNDEKQELEEIEEYEQNDMQLFMEILQERTRGNGES